MPVSKTFAWVSPPTGSPAASKRTPFDADGLARWALAKDYGPRGVHVGHVVVDGVINGDMVRGFLADYLEHLGEDGSLEPDAIAEAFWFLHSQPRNAWTFEVDLRPFKENW